MNDKNGKMEPITILLFPETIKQVKSEVEITGINKGVLLRSIIMKYYHEKEENDRKW